MVFEEVDRDSEIKKEREIIHILWGVKEAKKPK